MIAVVNQKGGVGKTTTAVTLAHGLALLGKRVLLVDLDAQGNVADALGMEKGDGVYRWLTNPTPSPSLGKGGEQNGVVRFSGRGGLSVLVGDKRTVEAREMLAGQAFREMVVKDGLERLGLPGFEVAILDTAPGADLLQVAALIAATEFIVPVCLDHLAMVGVVDLLATAASLARAGASGARFLGVLPTMWERTTRESQAQLEEMTEEFREWVWPPIPVDVRCKEAAAHGRTLWEWAPGCRALDGVEQGDMPRIGGYRAVLRRLTEKAGSLTAEAQSTRR